MTGAFSLIRNGLAQSDIDMGGFRLLNLDTSNLPPSGIPPTIVCPVNNWLNGWDAFALEWSFAQPNFGNLAGNLTTSQQTHIIAVGTVRVGSWQASPIDPTYLPTLNLIRPPALNLSLNNKRITTLADPVDPQDAVNFRTVEVLALNGIKPKAPVRVASTHSVLPRNLVTPIDGVTLNAGDRVLLKDQGHPEQNGIYIAQVGSWVYADDFDEADEMLLAYCVVLEGDTNSGTSWIQIDEVVLPLVDPKIFLLFSANNTIMPGDGLEKIGSVLNVLGTTGRIKVDATVDIDPAYVGQTSLTTLGTITTGAWHGTVIAPAFGGTGFDNDTNTCQLEVPFKVGNPTLAVAAGLELKITANSSVFVPITGVLATVGGQEKLTNKRIPPRVSLTGTTSSLIVDPISFDVFMVDALAGAVNVTTGFIQPDENEEVTIWFKDNGVARAITWDAIFVTDPAFDLPNTTNVGFWTYARFVYNRVMSKYVMVNTRNHIA